MQFIIMSQTYPSLEVISEVGNQLIVNLRLCPYYRASLWVDKREFTPDYIKSILSNVKSQKPAAYISEDADINDDGYSSDQYEPYQDESKAEMDTEWNDLFKPATQSASDSGNTNEWIKAKKSRKRKYQSMPVKSN